MKKQEVNNALVLLRKYADQSRLHIVRKLSREADKYRKRYGNEKQKAKHDRKSKRIVAEILSVKNVKKDDITKFALKNTHTLKEVLENPESKPYTRILTRISNYKIFSEKISDFKSKYPNYMNFLEPKKKNKGNPKQKKLEDDSNKKNSTIKTEIEDQETIVDNNCEIDEESDDTSGILVHSNIECTDKENISFSDETTINSIQVEDKTESINTSESETFNSSEQKSVKTNPITVSNTKALRKSLNKKNNTKGNQLKEAEKNALNTPKIINKQTVVKRFKDIIQDETSELDEISDNGQNPIEANIEVEKEVDPFFVTDDGETNYLSVALPKTNLIDENDFDDNLNNKFNHSTFSLKQNSNKRDKFDHKNKNYNSSKSNFKRKDQERNERTLRKSDKTKTNFKKFNERHNDKSISNKKQKANVSEDKANETLHPSWEAKRKQQQILQQGFQGKKIIFGD